MGENSWAEKWANLVADTLGIPEEKAREMIGKDSIMASREDDWHALSAWKHDGGTLNVALMEPKFLESFVSALEHFRMPYFAAHIKEQTGKPKVVFILRSVDMPLVERMRRGFWREEALERGRL